MGTLVIKTIRYFMESGLKLHIIFIKQIISFMIDGELSNPSLCIFMYTRTAFLRKSDRLITLILHRMKTIGAILWKNHLIMQNPKMTLRAFHVGQM